MKRSELSGPAHTHRERITEVHKHQEMGVTGGLLGAAYRSFPGASGGRESTCNAGDAGSIPGLGKFSGEGNGSPLQYSCLENSTDRGAWWATVHGVIKSRHD